MLLSQKELCVLTTLLRFALKFPESGGDKAFSKKDDKKLIKFMKKNWMKKMKIRLSLNFLLFSSSQLTEVFILPKV
ncbi:hypothetical protein CKF59_05505 [Psittacicella gerlachiana]|uniref:Uncharacterized protein n=1 Tax=Psittacicella gerlachiana TaxID=2028574 RepID=A0A3A1YE17_9GAMM|nr:hypothetical protein CKF59_05505 [Psittacicella gerlachiana]